MQPPEIVLFVGPTISHAEIAEILPLARCLPPAAQGDCYRAAQQRPSMIGLIDGYFEQVPAIWHKELLWAMQQGIHVFGSASMGALRAAELAPFGMIAVGEIARAYQSGQLDADDEVAIVHGPAEYGYRPLSVALVNIRATLAVALSQQIIDRPSHDRLIALAQQRFYPERSYQALMADAALAGFDPQQLARLATWIQQHQVDQKRADAHEMLMLMHAYQQQGQAPAAPNYRLAETSTWRKFVRSEQPRSH
ncbi:MAG: TfuA-like protein [Roseiflexaceae bacterium]